MMQITFIKKEKDKHVLICKRKDGTSTWINADEFFLQHDLLHYAVETAMKFKSAFYGMIAQGISITDFDLPADKRNINFSDEALLTEHIVNLVMIETKDGRFENFNGTLKESLPANKKTLSAALLSDDQLNLIHTTYDMLLQQWKKLKENETIILEFQA